MRQFGFGQPTGIDLPGETTGSRVPDKYWKAETGKTARTRSGRRGTRSTWPSARATCWSPPCRWPSACRPSPTAGRVWVPHLGLQITDASGNIIHQFESEKRSELGMSADILSLDPHRA